MGTGSPGSHALSPIGTRSLGTSLNKESKNEEEKSVAILAECPRCHKKQAVKNRNYDCGADLVKEKRNQKVRYWVSYRLPNGKQCREFVGADEDGRPLGIEEAKAAEGKRRAQKKENPSIMEKVPAGKMTFAKLTEWYLSLSPPLRSWLLMSG
jgi:hypothetical protein